jgi:N,N'-diacetyllegionaminate synthase
MKTLIIAEAGVNHNGSLDTAIQMIKVASECGADVIKFQTFNASKLVTRQARMADYQIKNTEMNESQHNMLARLQLDHEDFKVLREECERYKIEFLSTAFDTESLEFLAGMMPNRFKVPSGEITNLHYLRQVASYGKEIFLSTGMASMAEIQTAVNALENSGMKREGIVILHCTTNYPTQMHEVNLRAMNTIGREFKVRVGYSDHTLGIEVPVAAVALGATVIEKHFTIDREMAGPDHKASMEPEELKALVVAIRNTEIALGSDQKIPTESELQIAKVARKSIVVRAPIKKGEKFSTENLTCKRPGTGVSPMLWDEVIGTTALRDFEEDEVLEI